MVSQWQKWRGRCAEDNECWDNVNISLGEWFARTYLIKMALGCVQAPGQGWMKCWCWDLMQKWIFKATSLFEWIKTTTKSSSRITSLAPATTLEGEHIPLSEPRHSADLQSDQFLGAGLCWVCCFNFLEFPCALRLELRNIWNLENSPAKFSGYTASPFTLKFLL